MSSACPMLEVKGLAKRFAPRSGQALPPWVLADLSFHVAEEEFLTLVGPSGAGKSTLLNIIAQVDGANQGEIYFRGKLIETANGAALKPGWNCQIGYVTQDDNLLAWRTLYENVTLPLKLQGRFDAAGKERVNELLRATRPDGIRALLSARNVGRHAQTRRAHPHACLRPADYPHG